MIIFFLIEVTFPWKPAQWKHVLTFKGIPCGNVKLHQVVINQVLWGFLIFQKMWKHPACLLYHTNALLIAVQQVTVKRIDYTGICIYMLRFIFNCLEEAILISCQTVFWFSELLLHESPWPAMFCDKWPCSIFKCNYLKKSLQIRRKYTSSSLDRW